MRHLSILLVLIIISSCNQDPNMVVKNLEKEVISIHDEVMPKTNDLYKLKKELRTVLSQVQDSTQIFELIKQLDDADEVMMVWMDEYNLIDLKQDTSTNMTYLRDQKVKIEAVRDEMLMAIRQTEEFLSKNK